jgi:carboxyl-terminal processing protease
MRPQKYSIWTISLFFIAWSFSVTVSLLVGCRLINPPLRPNKIQAERTLDLRLIDEVWTTIQKVYVDRAAVKPQPLTYAASSGMVDALGDTGHSRFLTPEMVKQEHNARKGELEGIGAEVRMKNNQVVIVAPLDHSPAQKAGLKPGDVILKVNQQEMSGLPLDQVVERILGPPNTLVQLTILRPETGQLINFSIVRARITIRNVTWDRLPGTSVAHLRVVTFNRGSSDDFRKALRDIQQIGLDQLILDLRNNPGGLLDQAVSAASEFLDSGNVLLERNASGRMTPIPVRSGGVALHLPMVVLINGGTASAAEIVAGALQDAHRATLLGENTFGTGTVLQEFPLMDGSALLLATGEWLTPAGRVIWHVGIIPGVMVSLPSDVVPLFPEEKGMTAAKLQTSGDAQLLRALDLLTHSTRGEQHPSKNPMTLNDRIDLKDP